MLSAIRKLLRPGSGGGDRGGSRRQPLPGGGLVLGNRLGAESPGGGGDDRRELTPDGAGGGGGDDCRLQIHCGRDFSSDRDVESARDPADTADSTDDDEEEEEEEEDDDDDDEEDEEDNDDEDDDEGKKERERRRTGNAKLGRGAWQETEETDSSSASASDSEGAAGRKGRRNGKEVQDEEEEEDEDEEEDEEDDEDDDDDEEEEEDGSNSVSFIADAGNRQLARLQASSASPASSRRSSTVRRVRGPDPLLAGGADRVRGNLEELRVAETLNTRPVVYKYAFRIADTRENMRVFTDPDDRRIESIARSCDSQIRLEPTPGRAAGSCGLRMRRVTIQSPDLHSLEKCCRLFDDKFPRFYVTGGLGISSRAISRSYADEVAN